MKTSKRNFSTCTSFALLRVFAEIQSITAKTPSNFHLLKGIKLVLSDAKKRGTIFFGTERTVCIDRGMCRGYDPAREMTKDYGCVNLNRGGEPKL